MLAHSLQGTLLNINAVLFKFSDFEIGYVFTGYFIGFLASSYICPKIIKNVGHIRVFAAFASIASITILFHWIYVHPYFWFFLRLLTGFSLAAIYIVCESWLNDRADNRTRGKLIGFYMVILYFSTSGGGLLINLKETTEAHLYILTSLLISFALVPILLTKKSAPEFSTPKFISLKDLYKNSPMSFIGSFGIGMIYGASFGLIAVFGAKLGLSIFQISILVFVNTFIGALFQYPIGKLSDTYDRRIILLILNIIALVSSICLIIFGSFSFNILLLFVGIHSAVSLPYYAVVISHLNDFLEKDEVVSASSTLTLVHALGLVLAPILVSTFMAYFDAYGLFYYCTIVYLFLGLFTYQRIRIGRTSEIYDENTPTMIVPRTTSAIGMQTATEQMISKIDEKE